jgi:CheY-like chemotaxis protein
MRSVVADRTSVLVIEDDPWTRSLLEELMAGEDYSVSTCNSGEEGLQLVAQVKPAAVVLDLALPRMSGLEVLRTLKASLLTRDVPVVVVSAYVSQMNSMDAARADFLMEKPFDVETLLAALREMVKVSNANNRESARVLARAI